MMSAFREAYQEGYVKEYLEYAANLGLQRGFQCVGGVTGLFAIVNHVNASSSSDHALTLISGLLAGSFLFLGRAQKENVRTSKAFLDETKAFCSEFPVRCDLA